MAASQRWGLGQLAGGFGKASGVARIDLGQGQFGCSEATLEAAVIGAGGLVDDTRDRVLGKPTHEAAMALGIVGEAAGLAAGVEADVESVL